MVLSYEEFDELIEAVGLSGSSEKEALLSLFATLAASNLDDEQARTVLEIFSLEGLQSLQDTPEKVLKAQWEPFSYGNVKIGDFVKIKSGIYSDSQTGIKHEGRIGVLVSMTNYRCRIRYIGLHAGNIMDHPMENLQSMKRVR